MTEKKMALDNKILEVVVGSHMYGTSTPTSDKDYFGIFMPDKKFVYGFSKCEEVDLGNHLKLPNGKNAPEAIDRMFFEFRKFIKLALDNNPSVLELLFSNDNITYSNKYGKQLLDNKHLFPYQGLKERFIGYAHSQKHKMQVRSDKFNDLKDGAFMLNWLCENFKLEGMFLCDIFKEDLRDKWITTGHPTSPKYIKDLFRAGYDEAQNVTYVCVGDLNLQPSYTLKKALKEIETRLSKVGNRSELITDKGFDYKFGSHLIRLLTEGLELFETGELVLPLKQKDLILDIKQGNWKIEDVLKLSDELESKIKGMKTDLPIKPKYKEIEELTMEMLEEFLDEVSI